MAQQKGYCTVSVKLPNRELLNKIVMLKEGATQNSIFEDMLDAYLKVNPLMKGKLQLLKEAIGE